MKRALFRTRIKFCGLTRAGDVDPAFAALNARHERLMALEPVRQVVLAQACAFTRVDQRLAKCDLSRASDCLCHASHTFCDVASG